MEGPTRGQAEGTWGRGGEGGPHQVPAQSSLWVPMESNCGSLLGHTRPSSDPLHLSLLSVLSPSWHT